MSELAIDVQNLGKHYRVGSFGFKSFWQGITGNSPKDEGFWALKDISFEVKKGESVGIIGKNGAGKSTLLKILSRITSPTTGSIRINGKISSLLEVGTGFHPELTGRENIFLNGSIMGMKRNLVKERFDAIVDFAGVSGFLDTPVKRYSSGMYVRLAFAVAAHLDTEIMIIDEVLAVGDLDFQKKCLGKMREVSGNEGRTVLFVSHNMASVKALCSHGLFLEKGSLKMTGTVREITEAYISSNKGLVDKTALAQRNDRTGNGLVQLTGMSVQDASGNEIETVLTGEDLVLLFRLHVGNSPVRNIDFGLNFFDMEDANMGVNYSSYHGQVFSAEANSEVILECRVPKFPFTIGTYKVGTRILVNNEEADWLLGGAGFIRVENGNFFGTGSNGFSHTGMTNFLAEWKSSRIR
jgi:lipopolysaccharide transport system ATP-binding protein